MTRRTLLNTAGAHRWKNLDLPRIARERQNWKQDPDLIGRAGESRSYQQPTTNNQQPATDL